jgi:lipopolysaccharide transport system ATP-binding protein
MSSELAIKVENLSKCYQIYDKPRDRLAQMFFWGRKQFYREFWALKDVTFQIKKGETVGIIGRNGSGKSTLLQLICGTLAQTAGTIQSKGRVAALLELGSGFNPEFTGRENVHMNASILGLSPGEIDASFDAIVDFSGIRDFIEQPVKNYSSGMMVRLAFAVAIHSVPDILIVDEALAVGDELFQRKCFSRIESLRARGATILFVSHSTAQVVELCERALLIDDGELICGGIPKIVVRLYQKLMFSPQDKREIIREQIKLSVQKESESVLTDDKMMKLTDSKPMVMEDFDPDLKPDSTLEYIPSGAEIGVPFIADEIGRSVNSLQRGRLYTYSYAVEFSRTAANVRFGVAIKTTAGIALGGGISAVEWKGSVPSVKPGDKYRVTFKFLCNLNPGVYFTNAGVFGCLDHDEVVMHRKVDAIAFRVLPVQGNHETETVYFGIESMIEHECVS